MLHNATRFFLFVAAIIIPFGASARAWATDKTERVSVGSHGVPGNGASYIFLAPFSISGNGRFVTFESEATNLVQGDTNELKDVFVRDRQSGTTVRVSVGAGGAQGNGHSFWSAISAGGRFVAFRSEADNLVAGDTNGVPDIFMHDRRTGMTEIISVNSIGVQANDGSADPVIAEAGRFIAFTSGATNLAPDMDTNGGWDVFLRDRQIGTTEQISVSSGGVIGNRESSGPAISARGRYVAFESEADNLVPGDTNGKSDIFIRDRHTGITERLSVASDGTQGNGHSSTVTISADGRFAVFYSDATNLVPGDTNDTSDVFVRDRKMGTTERVSLNRHGKQVNDYWSQKPVISADGRFVAFISGSSEFVQGDTNETDDVFVRDRKKRTTVRASVSSKGKQANGDSYFVSISADGRFVAFTSSADNLVADDTNGREDEINWDDVFVRDLRR